MLFLFIMIDLHCHSHFSDGEFSPSILLSKAIDSRVRVLALTDHDTTAGLFPLHDAARGKDITIINGIELSVCWKKYDMPVLGLNINPDDGALCALIDKQNQSRISRAQQISECLAKYDIQDAYHKACEIAGHERVGRPHFAQLLIREGVVRDMKSAFTRFLGQGKVAYVRNAWTSVDDAVSAIIHSGGQAVIAHPLKYALTRSKLLELINAFKEVGGIGMEVVSGDVTIEQSKQLAELCRRSELFASTGSDYHSDRLSRVALGQQRALPVNCMPIWQQWNI